MVTISVLWMPILLASVLVFVASFLVWVVLPHHKNDWKGVPDEASLLENLRKLNIARGQYVFPYAASMGEMSNPEYLKKCEEGPIGFLTLRPPAKPAMAKPLVLSFVYYFLVSCMVAYVTGRTLPADAHYLAVFRVAGTVATLTYSGALFPAAIWFGRSWGSTIKEAIDGFAYGMLTAGAFGWLWPR